MLESGWLVNWETVAAQAYARIRQTYPLYSLPQGAWQLSDRAIAAWNDNVDRAEAEYARVLSLVGEA